MKKDQIPQDKSALSDFTREVCYAKDENGQYTTGLSTGWDVKKDALDNAWNEINDRVKEAAMAVKNGEKSPVVYFMEKKLMDPTLLADYTGFWKWSVKRHMKPDVFAGLSEKKLKRYAEVFGISVDELKNFKGQQ